MSGQNSIQTIKDKWFIKEPVFLMALLAHSVEQNPHIAGIRSGQGRIEYNPAYIASLSAEQFEEKFKIEIIRILLRHPYRLPPSGHSPELLYMASNITLNEYYTFNNLPYRVSDFWKGYTHYKKNLEFYYRELLKLQADGGVQEQNCSPNEAIENTGLWGDDTYTDMKVAEIIEFAEQNMSWGGVSFHLKQTLLAALPPVIDYRKILNSFRATVLSSEKTLTRYRPSRRYGFMYMGKKNTFTTRLLIGVDVSGSISDKEIRLFYSVINKFFKYGIEAIDVVQFDSGIQGDPVLMKKARKEIKVMGRGGTDFQPVIDCFEQRLKYYDGLIVFTDGYAPVPKVSPRAARKILWLCNNEAGYKEHCGWMSRLGRCGWI